MEPRRYRVVSPLRTGGAIIAPGGLTPPLVKKQADELLALGTIAEDDDRHGPRTQLTELRAMFDGLSAEDAAELKRLIADLVGDAIPPGSVILLGDPARIGEVDVIAGAFAQSGVTVMEWNSDQAFRLEAIRRFEAGSADSEQATPPEPTAPPEPTQPPPTTEAPKATAKPKAKGKS